MPSPLKRLSDAELEIMLVLWRAEGPVTSGHVRDALRGRRDWALSTLMSALDKLAGHGFVACDRSTRTNLYSARVSEGEYKVSESRTLLGKLYGNSVNNLVAGLYEGNALSAEELDDLSRTIERLREGTAP